jgi:hypothetical protein
VWKDLEFMTEIEDGAGDIVLTMSPEQRRQQTIISAEKGRNDNQKRLERRRFAFLTDPDFWAIVIIVVVVVVLVVVNIFFPLPPVGSGMFPV